MPILLVRWALTAGALAVIASRLPTRPALATWAVFSVTACLLGAVAISRQPLGQATIWGQIGSAYVRWGFRAGHGRLAAAVVISLATWLLLGSAAILAWNARADPRQALIIVAWAANVAVLFYLVGVMLANPGTGRQLSVVAAAVVGLIVASAAIWSGSESAGARRLALMIAGGPVLFIGIGYGLFLLVVLVFGRNARWN